jgi:hypothetical protein
MVALVFCGDDRDLIAVADIDLLHRCGLQHRSAVLDCRQGQHIVAILAVQVQTRGHAAHEGSPPAAIWIATS